MDPLEKLFQQVEEESERRAQTLSVVAAATGRPSTAETALTTVSECDMTPASISQGNNSTTTARRRGGSVSVTRFGQLSLEDRQGSSQSITPSIIVSKLPSFYQAQLAKNDSFDSLIYDKPDEDVHEDYHAEIVDDNVVTQVFRSSTRTNLTKAMGDLIPRRLSRSNSEHGIPNLAREPTVIVDIQVERATVEVTAEDSEEPVRGATVHAPNSIQRRASANNLLGTATSTRAAWIAKAKDFSLKIRQRSKTVLSSST
ncbi:hypothetical protein JOM56_002848 [Amanita muscaria]